VVSREVTFSGLKIGDQIADWVIESPIGEGGMGAVYRCHNALVPRILAAVKVLKPHALNEARERFFREVTAVDGLRHPNIVQIKGFGEDESRGLLWMAMELVEGRDLDEVFTEGPMPPEKAVALVDALLDALQHAHESGIHHRDLKPGNILIDTHDRAKLVDFGIATQEGVSRLTQTGLVVGTPAYMAPEIFEEAPIEPAAADIYAMGLILYELLKGGTVYPEDKTLSESQRLARIFAAKMHAEPLDPGDSFPNDIRRVVQLATYPDPRQRFSTVAEFRSALSATEIETTASTPPHTHPSTQWVSDPVRSPKQAVTDEPIQTSKPPQPHPKLIQLVVGLGAIAVLGAAGVGVLVCATNLSWSQLEKIETVGDQKGKEKVVLLDEARTKTNTISSNAEGADPADLGGITVTIPNGVTFRQATILLKKELAKNGYDYNKVKKNHILFVINNGQTKLDWKTAVKRYLDKKLPEDGDYFYMEKFYY
jgi:serine/threonine-protein kinase